MHGHDGIVYDTMRIIVNVASPYPKPGLPKSRIALGLGFTTAGKVGCPSVKHSELGVQKACPM